MQRRNGKLTKLNCHLESINMKIKTLHCVHASDIAALSPEADEVMRWFFEDDLDVTFGDAAYTLIHWERFVDLLQRTVDHNNGWKWGENAGLNLIRNVLSDLGKYQTILVDLEN